MIDTGQSGCYTATMFTYVAYGLTIHSALPLPELVAGQGPADVTILTGRVTLPPQASAEESSYVAAPHEIYLYWPEVGSFQICDGRQILVDIEEGTDPRAARLNLLGLGLALLLQQRGRLVLHGSAVAVEGQALVFLGASGAGKSTTAAALVARGHRLLTDDVVTLTSEPVPQVQPAYPQLKLWPEAAQALRKSPAELEELHPLLEKRAERRPADFDDHPAPLQRIYVLAGAERLALQPLSSGEALAELVRHAYCAGLVGYSGHVQQCVRLLRHAQVVRLLRPSDLAGLDRLAELAELGARS